MIIAFGNLFNEIYIERYVSDTDRKLILVPLSNAPKEKFIVRLKQNPYLEDGNIAISLPRMAFQLDSFAYSNDRKLISTGYNSKVTSNSTKNKQYNPAPYDFLFSLYILTDSMEDGTQILEQILPFFTPEYTVTVNTIPELDIKHDIPIVLNGVNSIEDLFDTPDFQTKRLITWTLSFTMHGYIYGPIKEVGIIRKTITDIHNVPTQGPVTDEEVLKTPRHERITITPNPSTAGPNDPYTYHEEIEFFNDNKHYNPHTGNDEEIV